MTLPTGYTEVQYIQSSGTQYVDTGFKPNQNSRCICDFQYTANATAAIFMSRSITNNSAMFGIFNIGGTLRSDYNTEKKSFPTSLSPLGRLIYDKNKNICQIGDETITNTAGTFSAAYNLYLFCSNDGNTAAYFASGYLYSCQIYDNGSLIRDYIPCINPDGEAGLYDTVNSKFYGNAGTGVFIPGPRRVALPSSYTQLEYILANGAQYIDTGVAINSQTFDKLEFECDSLYPSLISSAYLVHGCSGSGVVFYFGLNNTNGTVVYGPGTSDQVTSYRAVANTRYHIIYSPRSKTYAFGENTPVTIAISSPSGNSNFYLFAYNKGNSCDTHPERLYSFKARMNGTLIRDYIPCMNAAGAIGLYDLVNSNFYPNAGTGVFTAGPEVTWPSNDAIYVKVNGIWRQIDRIKLL